MIQDRGTKGELVFLEKWKEAMTVDTYPLKDEDNDDEKNLS